MFTLDFRTIFFSYLITTVISLAIITLLFFQVKKKFQGTFYILLTFILNTIGVSLIFIRGVLPDWVTMSVANTFIFSSTVFILLGLEKFFNAKSTLKYIYLLIIAYFLTHLFFVVIYPSLIVRVLFSTSFLLYVFFVTAWFLLKKVAAHMRKIASGVAFTFLAYCGLYVWHLVYLVIKNYPSNSYFHSNTHETWFIIANQVAFLFLAFNLSLMYNKRLIIDFASQEEKFKELIKNSQDMFVLLDANGKQQFVSESCENILGFKPDELTNIKVIEKMIHPDDKKKVANYFEQVSDNPNQIYRVQYRHKHKSKEYVWLEAVAQNFLNNSAIEAVVANVRDVTSFKENETQLKELNATKDKFFSIIAHDLKTPFNGILGFSEILCEQVKNRDCNGIEEYSSIIYQSSHKALDLLTNLMEWSKIQSGRMEFNPEYVEVVYLINDTIELLINSAQQKSITISKKLPHNLIVSADKAMISTVLRNLISNAIKFSPIGGEIIISASQNESELLVSVTDNGVGITKNNINKLFRIDENFTTPGTENEKGTGLGLILCNDFIDKHNGRMLVKSESGNGSTFSFTIPLKAQ